MLHKSKIGVCLDYSIAYLLEEKNEEKVITIIESDEEEAIQPNADDSNQLRKRRKNQAYFKQVFEIVKDFDKVLLFGPASVKKELVNRIKAHKLFNIEILNNSNKDQVTESEKIEFINNYFEN